MCVKFSISSEIKYSIPHIYKYMVNQRLLVSVMYFIMFANTHFYMMLQHHDVMSTLIAIL